MSINKAKSNLKKSLFATVVKSLTVAAVLTAIIVAISYFVTATPLALITMFKCASTIFVLDIAAELTNIYKAIGMLFKTK